MLAIVDKVTCYNTNYVDEVTCYKGVFTLKSIIAISNCYFVTAIIEQGTQIKGGAGTGFEGGENSKAVKIS